MRKLSVPRAIPFIWLLFFVSGCRYSSLSDQRPDTGYLTVGIESHPLNLDPRFATDANSSRVGGLIYNSLLRADARGQLQTDLAERWESIDGTTYIFDLRRGVRFHDGRPLTARDVKYTYDSILDLRNGSPKRGLLKPLQAVDVLSEQRVRFNLAQPHAPFVEQFTLGIVPASRNGVLSPGMPPPGSGPFMFLSAEPGERIVLQANPSYWQGPPGIAGVIFKTIPDSMVRVLEFKNGSIDFLQNDIEPDMLPWLAKNTGAHVEVRQGTTFQYIGINLSHPILRERKVRQAIALAIDRQRIIRHLLKDLGTPATGLLSPLNWAYEGAVDFWAHDPERAKRLLDEAGFFDPDGIGPRPRFKLSFKTTNIDLRRRIAEAFKEQLQTVGIELEIRSYEWATFYADIKKGNFHLFSLAWVGIMDPDIYYQVFHSSSAPPGGNNRGRYANPELDALLERGRHALDTAERHAIYAEVQKIVARELPYVPLWWVKNVIVQQPALRGFVPYPDGDLISLKNVAFSPRSTGMDRGNPSCADCSKRLRGEARDTSTSAGVQDQYVGARRLSATKPMSLFEQSARRRAS